ncbi:hypothetical protein ACJX0J_006771, partial [Zea mays]
KGMQSGLTSLFVKGLLDFLLDLSREQRSRKPSKHAFWPASKQGLGTLVAHV